jgi:hypothetical protein
MANEPKTGTVQTPLEPLREDFFELEPKAKLRAQLAQAHDIWRGATYCYVRQFYRDGHSEQLSAATRGHAVQQAASPFPRRASQPD